MHVTSFDGIKIYYKKTLSENSLGNILFVHGGFYGNHTRLNKLIDSFKENYNVFAPDLRGKGDSDFPKDLKKVKLADYATDLYELLKKEKIKETYVVGISFGGLVSLKFAELFGKKINIKKLALLSSSHRLDKIRKRVRLAQMVYSPFMSLITLIALPLKERRKYNIDYSNYKNDLIYGLKLIKSNSLKTETLRFKLLKKAKKYKLTPGQLKKIKTETLIIYGNRDFFFPKSVEKELLENTNSTLRIIKKAGHNLYVRNVGQASKMIKDFFLES